MPPPMPSHLQADPRSRKSRTKMKCLIYVGIILPALAAVIGVAAWAVSADVVMNSGNNRQANKVDNNMLQNYATENENRRDIFRMNEEIQRLRTQTHSTAQPSTTTSTTTTTTTTTTPSTTTSSTTAAPLTLSPQEETDVNAILSKLISASGAASGGNGPRFVVVAPLPDNPEVAQPLKSSQTISRADSPSTKPHSREDSSWQVSSQRQPESDLQTSESSQNVQRYQVSMGRAASSTNLTNRMGLSNSEASSNRRMAQKPFVISASSNGNGGGAQIELTGFEAFDNIMQDFQQASQNNHNSHHVPPPSYHPPNSYTAKRGPPQGSFNRNQHKPLSIQLEMNEPHMFHHPRPEHNANGLKLPHGHVQGLIPGMPPPGIGLKPIQQQMHHIDPMQPSESNRWGAVGFHGPPVGGYVPKPPEGISLSISSPANSGTHVSVKEPVSVIKSFFLPFLPKPRLNMNARVVFGVVLDKGMGLGGDKKKYH